MVWNPALMKFINRFSFRLNISILLIHLLTTLLVFTLAIKTVNRAIKSGFIDQARTTSGLVANQIGNANVHDQPDQLKLLLEDLLLSGNVTYAAVTNKDHKIIYTTDPDRDQYFKEDFVFDNSEDNTYYIEVPFFSATGNPVGTLKLGFCEKLIREDLQQINKQLLIITISYLIIVALVIIFISSRLTRPLNNLRLLAKEVVHNHNKRIYTRSTIQEITDLAQNLEEMRKQLVARQETLAEREYYTSTIINNMADAMITFNEHGYIQDTNTVVENLFGYPEDKLHTMMITDLIEQPLELLFQGVFSENGENTTFIQEATALKMDNSSFHVEYVISKINFGGKDTYIILIRDVSERKQAEEKLYRSANFDNLTNLPNRNLFYDRLEHAMSMASRNETLLAVIFIDLDHFKIINDTLGHAAGDKLLQEVSLRLNSVIRKSDTVARLGGDEFVIILESLSTVHPTAHTARKIIDSLHKPFLIQDQEIFVTPSIGISIYPFGGVHADDLVVEADIAMYRAKRRGRNTYEFYTQKMNARSTARLNMETSLRRALDKEEYVLYYQPQYDIIENKMIGMEALLRWNNSSKGLVPPIEFIPILEETGLIIEVGNWVIESSIKQIAEWMGQYSHVPKVAINISARQFDTNDLPLQIEKILTKYNVPAAQLEVEVTESEIMNDLEQTSRQLNALHRLGISIALDDFGTGHSSLVYLKNYPIDTIKIDKSFINNLCYDQSNQAITRAIIAMSRALEMNILAEGVETEEQKTWLKSHYCNLIQGYLFARPMPVKNISALLNAPKSS